VGQERFEEIKGEKTERRGGRSWEEE
jgi:hypothetical protein